MAYEPPRAVLERYAQLLIEIGLMDGRPFPAGDTVLVRGAEQTKPLFAEVCRAVWKAGGNVITDLQAAAGGRDDLTRIFYETATDAQLDFFPSRSQG